MGDSGDKVTRGESPLPPPLGWSDWEQVRTALRLPPQQARIVELVMLGHSDRQIAKTLGLRCPTVRTYLNRTFERAEVPDRRQLVRRIYSIAIEGWSRGWRPPS